MAENISELLAEIQDLTAKLESMGFGGETESVTHNSVTRPTLQKAIADNFVSLQAMISGREVFETKATMESSTGHADDTLATVWNDPDPDSNGLYGKTAAAWIKSIYDGNRVYAPISAGLFNRDLYVNAAGGNSAGGGLFSSTDFIDIENITVTDIRIEGHPNISTVAFYDSNKSFLSGFTGVAGVAVSAYPSPPVAAKYVVFSAIVSASIGQYFNFQVSDFVLGVDFKKYESAARGVVVRSIELLANTTGFINKSGAVSVDSNWGCSDFMPISPGDIFTVDVLGHTEVSSIAFYDSSRVFLASFGSQQGDADTTVYKASVSAPPLSAYYRITIGDAEILGSASGVSNNVIGLRVDLLGAIESEASERLSGRVSVNITSEIVNAGYLNLLGDRASSFADQWVNSDFIPVNVGDEFYCYMVGNPMVNAVSFYNEKKRFVSGYSIPSGNVFDRSVTVPPGITFARFSTADSVNNSESANVAAKILRYYSVVSDVEAIASRISQVERNSELVPFNANRRIRLSSTDKVILYGTSISSQDYPWYESSMAELTGAVVYAGGFSGYPASALASDVCLQRIFDYDPQLIVTLVGGNSHGAANSVGSFSGAVAGEPIVEETDLAVDYAGEYFIQAVSHIIRRIQAKYSNFRARAGLIGDETHAEKESKIDAVNKPVLVFCTPLPQQRNDANDQFSDPENWERKRAAVLECCNKYGVHCVDLFSKIPFDMSVEPYWSGTDFNTNNGLYFMDGLHPNKYGYQAIAEVICADLGL